MVGEGETSPPVNFYADGPSGVMAGTAGITVQNNGPGASFCVITSAIDARAAG